jgi:hypothetical protein
MLPNSQSHMTHTNNTHRKVLALADKGPFWTQMLGPDYGQYNQLVSQSVVVCLFCVCVVWLCGRGGCGGCCRRRCLFCAFVKGWDGW